MYISKYKMQMFLFIQISLSYSVRHLLLAVLYDPSLASIQIQQDKSDVAESFPFSALHCMWEPACFQAGGKQCQCKPETTRQPELQECHSFVLFIC